MKKSSAVLAIAFVAACCLLAACNKGRSIIKKANAEHDAGRLDSAVALLHTVDQEAPNTPEVGEARRLAVRWLIEAADQEKAPEAKDRRLSEALRWDPKSGPAQARQCSLRREAGEFNKLRACLDGLSTMDEVPADIAAPLRAALQAHDEETERKAWLASADPVAWLRLVKKYPESAEAADATKQALGHYTFCGTSYETQLVTELLAATDKPSDEARGFAEFAGQAELEYQARNRFAVGLAVVAGHQEENVTRLHEVVAAIKAHRFLPEESKVREEVLKDYASIIELSKRWSTLSRFSDLDGVADDPLSAFQAVSAANLAAGTRLSKRITDRISGPETCSQILNDDTRKAVLARIVAANLGADGQQPAAPPGTAPADSRTPAGSAAPTEPAAPADCYPCSTQEDFDVAWQKHKKCCPVRGCEGDSDCPGERVCCRIPMGTLCTDAKRCGRSDRVR